MDGAAAPIAYPWSEAPAPGEAREVAQEVLWLRLPLPMALDHVNVYALADADGWTIVDTGISSTRSRALWQTILDGPLAGKPVARVLLTHHHPDHVGLAGWFASEHGAEILAPRTAWLTARMLTLDVQEVPSPETVAFWRAAGMPADLLAQRMTERPYNFADTVWPIPVGFTRLSDGQSLRLAGRVWDVRFGQGHAPDHATLWSRDDPLVLGGDQLLPSISPNLGVYPTEPQADPVGEWLDSIGRLAPHATDDQLVLPGHKLPYTGLPGRMTQLEGNHHSALERLRAWLAEGPRTAHDCFVPLFRREITGSQYGLALVEAVAHLNHLHRHGEVVRTSRSDGAHLWHLA